MATIVDVHQLTKSFGGRALLRGASFALEEAEKVGIVGVNGSGKSTLLRILAGEEGHDEGTIATRRGARVAYLPQEPELPEPATVLTAAVGGRSEVTSTLAEYQRVSSELVESAEDSRLLARHDALASRLDALGAWAVEHRAEAVLTRLGLSGFERSVALLSGGEKKRVALARALLDPAELLLLDEPTNHLDADTTQWLEEHLLQYPGAVLLITHDRYFLDRVVTRMLEIEDGRVTSFPGGYTEYLEAKAERRARSSAEQAKRARLIEQELEWVRRSPAARTGKQEARIKRLGVLQAKEEARRVPDREAAEIRFGAPPRLGRTVLDLKAISKSYGDRRLMHDLDLILRAGERLGIVGPNGAGKTTLLRMIAGLEVPDAGEVVLGENTRIAYFDQQREDLDPDVSILDAVAATEWVTLGSERVHIRSYLERFLFPTSTHEQRVRSLSGGERSRILLARLFLREANLIILDEPTNDLDLVTLQVLESLLAEFPGCVLMVTHDRFFLDKIATRLLVFEGDGVVHDHAGGYDLYRRLREQKSPSRVERGKPGKVAADQRPRGPAPSTRKLSYREQRELEEIDSRILAAEARKAGLADRLADPALYADTPGEVARLAEEFHSAEAEVEALYLRWEELERARTGE
jgi:ABC transport system ATP-binding/permease protein